MSNIYKIYHSTALKSDSLAYMFVWCCSSRSRIFHSFGVVTITGEGLQVLTYIRQRGFFNVSRPIHMAKILPTWRKTLSNQVINNVSHLL